MLVRRVLAGTAAALLMPATLTLAAAPGAATDTTGATVTDSSLRSAAAQRVRLEALPQVVHPGRHVASPDEAEAALVATVVPASPGRQIVLQVQRGVAWEWVDTIRQRSDTRVHFGAPATSDGQPLTYRIKAARHRGLGSVISDPASTAPWLAPTWTDEFDGSELSPTWHHRGTNFEPQSLRSCSQGDPSAVRVGGGTVRLSVLRDPTRTEKCKAHVRGEYIGKFAYRLNGHIGTEGAFSFTYGFAAARIKFHRQRGQHGSFWMQPVGGMFPGGSGHEIDVIEYFGDRHPLGGLATFIHRYEGERMVKTGARVANVRSFLKDRRDGWSKNYHVFSVQWTPRRLIFRIDGKESHRINGGISNAPQYPILSLLSSDYEFVEMTDRQLPQHMYVDWVRVWETGDQATAE